MSGRRTNVQIEADALRDAARILRSYGAVSYDVNRRQVES